MFREIVRSCVGVGIARGAKRFEDNHPRIKELLHALSARFEEAASPNEPAHSRPPVSRPSKPESWTTEALREADTFYTKLMDRMSRLEIYRSNRSILSRSPEQWVEACELSSEWDALSADLKEIVVAQLFKDFNFSPAHRGAFAHLVDAPNPRLSGIVPTSCPTTSGLT